MSEITELNRKPDIGGDVISAVSVGADSATVGSLEAGTSITDPADNTITDFVGGDLTLDNGTLKAITSPDVRTSLNDLFVRNANQDFELGLTQLNYRDGQFEIFADGSKIASSTNLNLVLGSPLNGSGYVALQKASIGDISTEQDQFTGHSDSVISVFISGSFGYSGSRDNTVKKWDVDTMTEQDEFTGHTSLVLAVYVDGSFGYSAGFGDFHVRKWDTDTMTEQDAYTGHTEIVNAVFVDGQYGYSGDDNAFVKKWDVDTMTEQSEMTAHTSNVTSIYVDGSFGYSCANSMVRKWDVDTMTHQVDSDYQFSGHSSTLNDLHIAGNFGYSASDDNTVKKWDVDTMSEQNEFTGHGTADVNTVFIAGSFGYSGDVNGVVKKWDVDTMTEQDEFTGHTDAIRSIYVGELHGYSGANDNAVKKWGEGIEAETNGNVKHVQQDIGFVPNTAVISDDLRQLPTGADVYYEIEDGDGNVVTINRDDIDGEVDLSDLTSSKVSTTAHLERPDTDTASPELDAWALYLNE